MGRRATETLDESVGRRLCGKSGPFLTGLALPCLGLYPGGSQLHRLACRPGEQRSDPQDCTLAT